MNMRILLVNYTVSGILSDIRHGWERLFLLHFMMECVDISGGAGNYLFMKYYRCVAPNAPFFSAARYTISPLFLRKSKRLTQFFIIDICMIAFSGIPV